MRRRENRELPFLERPADYWASFSRRPPGVFDILKLLAGMYLAERGDLRPDELARLERIASGAEEHRTIRPDGAARILARHHGRDAYESAAI